MVNILSSLQLIGCLCYRCYGSLEIYNMILVHVVTVHAINFFNLLMSSLVFY